MSDLAKEGFTAEAVGDAERAMISAMIAQHGMWGEHQDFTQELWRQRVADRETLLSYWHWVVRMMQATVR